MIEVHPRLFVGSQNEYEALVKAGDEPREGWAVVHACKEPYHREALGYSGRGAPKDHDEYLFARRGDRLCLNLVDVDNVDFIREELIEAALSFISEQLDAGKKVLVHCNQGQSRGPSIALLWMRRNGSDLFSAADVKTFDEATELWRKIYPPFEPARGMADYLELHWDDV